MKYYITKEYDIIKVTPHIVVQTTPYLASISPELGVDTLLEYTSISSICVSNTSNSISTPLLTVNPTSSSHFTFFSYMSGYTNTSRRGLTSSRVVSNQVSTEIYPTGLYSVNSTWNNSSG